MTQIAEKVIDKALKRLMLKAQNQARQQLCRDCLDQRCLTGSICKTFIMLSKAIAWEIIASQSETN